MTTTRWGVLRDKFVAHPVLIVLSLYLLLAVVYYLQGFLVHLDGRIRGVDSIYYYIYLPSLFFDGDFDFLNNVPTNAPELRYTAIGKVENVFSIGPAILWTPFFLLGHLATLLGRGWFDLDLATNGYSGFYHLAVYLGNSLYGLAGLIVTNRLLQHYVRPGIALLATVSILLASQITFYLWDVTAVSHNGSLFISALFLLIWRRHGMHPFTAMAGALMILVRWQDGLMLLVPALAALATLPAMIRQKMAWRWLGQAALFLAILLVGFSPQLLAWKAIFGTYLLVPQGSGFLSFSNLPLWDFLFSTRHGLFLWHPLLLLGFGGLLLLWSRDRLLAASLLAVFVAEMIINAAVMDWWASWSFGQRRFINYLPVFALGVGLLLERLHTHWQRGAAIGLILLLSIWNLLFVAQFYSATIPRSLALTTQEMVWDKFQIRFVNDTRKISFSAMLAYEEKDFGKFRSLAEQAYAINPDDRTNRAVFVLSAMMFNQYQDGAKAMARWLEDEPGALLPRWGVADILVQNKLYEEAATLFPITEGMSAEERAVRAKIDARAPTTLTEDFVTQLDKYLWSFYYD